MEIMQQPVPLQVDAEGVVRVGGTRIPLETVVTAFEQGATAEEILQQYPSLALADVYAAISYYLRNKDEVGAYLRERRAQGLRVREEHEVRFSSQGIRERLLARRTSRP